MLNVVLEVNSRMCSKCTYLFSLKAYEIIVLSNSSSESKWDMAIVKFFVARMIILHELPLAFVENVGLTNC